MRLLMQMIVLFSIVSLFFSFACKQIEKNEVLKENHLSLNLENARLEEGDTLDLVPKFSTSDKFKSGVTWLSDDLSVVEVSVNQDYSARITAKSKGIAKVTVSTKEGNLSASCIIIVEEKIVRILAIGNSFSQDALESYLFDLAKQASMSVVIGNLYNGTSSSLLSHWNHAKDDMPVYEYRKINKNGVKSNTRNTSIQTALADEKWDYISFQQVSSNSGQYQSYITPLPLLFNYVRQRATNPHVKYIFHQTWAYAQHSTHKGFLNYNNDQNVMYSSIVEAVSNVKSLVKEIDLVVPSGTAIQNGRSSIVGDNFDRDGYHLNEIGKYTAACTWFEAIFQKNVIGNLAKPLLLSDEEVLIAQVSAHNAVVNPKSVTKLDGGVLDE